MPSASPKIRVAIAGGGISGLCLAIGLLKCPLLDVQVYEGAKAFADIGAGLALHGNAIRAMEMIGPEVKQAYFDSARLIGEDENEELATEVLVAQGKHANEQVAFLGRAKGRKTVARADLLHALLKRIPSECVHFGKRVSHIDVNEHESIKLGFTDGGYALADCLVGADGIHSPTRTYLLGADHPATLPKDQGWVVFRRLVPVNEAKKSVDPKWIKNVPIFCGQDGMINSIPIHNGQTLSISVHLPRGHLPDDALEGAPILRTESFDDWIPAVRSMVELVSKDPGEPWFYEDHDAAPYYHLGRVAMIGDAAHATTSFAGQGAAQAIEDASTLCTLFQHIKDVSQISKAFEAYDMVRRPRSQKVVEMSRLFGRIYAFREEGVGDDLNLMRKSMGEAAWMNNADLQAQNDKAISYFDKIL